MNTSSIAQLIIGSWELVSTTQNDVRWTRMITHFSADGLTTCDIFEIKEFIYPTRYKIDGDNLIFSWAQWGKEDTSIKISFEDNGELKMIDPKGFVSILRKIENLPLDTFSFLDSLGKLKRRNAAEQDAAANP